MLKRLEDWVKEGRRSIKININTFGSEVDKKIFIFDADTGEGLYIDDLNELDTVDFAQLKKESDLLLLKQCLTSIMYPACESEVWE